MSADTNSASDQKEKILSILEGIKLHIDTKDLKKLVGRCSFASVSNWKDDNSLDLLHHCILENNLVAFVVFLNLGHFKPPYEPVTWPYLHLVACLGHRAFISTIIQDIKYQCNSIILNWDIYYNVIKQKTVKYTPELKESEKTKKHSPLDIAGLFGHMNCVQLLLDFWQVHNSTYSRLRPNSKPSDCSYLTLACKANAPNAVRLLLTENVDKKEALESAIKMEIPECVDIVLREGGTNYVKDTFQGMNLFHVIFSYNSCRTPAQYEAMLEMVSILVRHKQDVNAFRPSRTFPLYSLLSHEPVGCPIESCSPCLMAALLVLLNAGANPNFDEIFAEENLFFDTEYSTAFGRRPYSNAVNCFLCTLPMLKGPCDTEAVTKTVNQYADRVIELLIRHGADLAIYSKFNTKSFFEDSLDKSHHEGTALHVLASTRPKAFTSYSTLRLLLNYGIDVDVKGKWSSSDISIKYALNIFPISLCTSTVENTKLLNFSKQDMKNVIYCMKFMSQSVLVSAYKEFLEVYDEVKRLSSLNMDSEIQINLLEENYFDQIKEQYELCIRSPWLLKKCCSHTIWRACRMHVGNIYELPIPNPLKRTILDFH